MRTRIIARNSVLRGLDLASGLVTGVITSVVVGRAMGPEVLGEYNYILWVINTATLLAATGIPVALWKFASQYTGAERVAEACALIQASVWAQAVLSVFVLIVGLACVAVATAPAQASYAYPVLFAIVPGFMMGVISAAISTTEDVTWLVLPSVISSVVGLVGVLLTLRFGWYLPGLAWSFFISRMVDVAIRSWAFHGIFGAILKPSSRWFGLQIFTPQERRQFVRFAGQATLLMVVQAILWGRSEVWFLKHFRSDSEVSFFSLGFNFLDRINLVPIMLAGSVSTSMMVEFGRSKSSAGLMALAGLRYIALFTSPLVVGLVAVSTPLISVLYGHAFLPAILPLVIQGVLFLPRILLQPSQDMLRAADRQDLLLKWGLILCAINLGLDAALVPWGGANGASWANGIAQLIATLIMWHLAIREFRLPFPWSGLLRIMGAASAMALIVWIAALWIPPVAVLVLALPVGTLLFSVFLRAFRALDERDRYRLLSLESNIPDPIRGVYVWLVRVLARDRVPV